MSVNIRYPDRRDLNDLVSIDAKAKPRQRWSEKDFTAFIGSDSTRAFVAEEGSDHVVGFMLLEVTDGKELAIKRIRYETEGVAEQMLLAAEAFNSKTALKSELTAYVDLNDKKNLEFFCAHRFSRSLTKEDLVRFSKSS